MPAWSLPLPDRGLDFGDGLFETLLLHGGEALHLPLHLERLERGLRALAFPDCLTTASAQLGEILQSPALREMAWAALRLTVSRGGGPRGYAPPAQALPRIVIAVTPLQRSCAELASPSRLGVASMRWGSQPALAGIKHLNRLEQVLAAREAAQSGADDMVMLDQAGKVVSTTAGNLYMFAQGKIHTPRIGDCGIAGTRRKLLLEQWAPALGLEVVQRDLDPAELVSAEELFYSNSLWGLRPVGELGARLFQHHPVCNALFTQYLAGLE